MRIISRKRLREFWQDYPDAEAPLRKWYAIVEQCEWKNPAAVKRVFGKNVDFVQVSSGNTVAVFNIHGNKYRLVAAIHYDFPRVFVLRVMTHAEYDTNNWKREL